MRRPLRSCASTLLVLASLALGLVIYLELGSRQYGNPQDLENSPPTAPAPVCDLERYPLDSEKLAFLAGLVQKYSRGESITPLDLDQAILLSPQSEMPGLNGVLCNGMIYISQRLEGLARYYVARHELEHSFQQAGLDPDCQDWELCATWKAARDYPLGFLAAIGSSLRAAYASSASIQDFLFGSWLAFKYYLLP